MSQNNSEKISALIDAELGAGNTDEILDQLTQDEKLRRDWERYHLIGEAMKKNLPPAVSMNLSSRVKSAIADEPPLNTATILPLNSTDINKPPRNIRYTGYAVAASVAFVGIVTVAFFQNQSSTNPNVNVAENIQPISNAGQNVPVATLSNGSTENLQRYVRDHELSTLAERNFPRGARVVNFESNSN